MSVGVVLDAVFTEHESPPGHPERADRIHTLLNTLDLKREGLFRVEPVKPPEEAIVRVHAPEHVSRIRESEGRYVMFDLDTRAAPQTFEVASLMAGSGVELVKRVCSGQLSSAALLGRPPGHHAESHRAMGFCFFNNVAVAAEQALRSGWADRVAIVDFDVHHGNGTQEIFYGREEVLYLSSHQYPFYPGTGAVGEIGEGAGRGATVNLPISAGKGDTFFLALYRSIVVPILEEYAPDLLLISAGYDAHERDPLGGMAVTTEGFGALVRLLNEAASKLCRGRIAYFLEGGYDLEALADSVGVSLSLLLDPEAIDLSDLGEESPGDFESYRSEIAPILGQYWQVLSS